MMSLKTSIYLDITKLFYLFSQQTTSLSSSLQQQQRQIHQDGQQGQITNPISFQVFFSIFNTQLNLKLIHFIAKCATPAARRELSIYIYTQILAYLTELVPSSMSSASGNAGQNHHLHMMSSPSPSSSPSLSSSTSAEQQLFIQRVAVIYALYCVWESSPVKGRPPIELSLGEWQLLRAVAEECSKRGNVEAVWIFRKLAQDKCINICHNSSSVEQQINLQRHLQQFLNYFSSLTTTVATAGSGQSVIGTNEHGNVTLTNYSTTKTEIISPTSILNQKQQKLLSANNSNNYGSSHQHHHPQSTPSIRKEILIDYSKRINQLKEDSNISKQLSCWESLFLEYDCLKEGLSSMTITPNDNTTGSAGNDYMPKVITNTLVSDIKSIHSSSNNSSGITGSSRRKSGGVEWLPSISSIGYHLQQQTSSTTPRSSSSKRRKSEIIGRINYQNRSFSPMLRTID